MRPRLLALALLLAGPLAAQPWTATGNYAGDSDSLHDFGIAIPSGSGPWPVIVWAHPGGWVQGWYGDAVNSPSLTARGWAVMSINYRLAPAVPWPAQLYDFKAAVRWVRANAATYNIDPARVVAGGSSAGAHLALMMAATNGNSAWNGTVGTNLGESSSVIAVAGWSSGTDLVSLNADLAPCGSAAQTFMGDRATWLLGCSPAACPSTAQQASPYYYVSPSVPPHFTVHGDADCKFPVGQVSRLDAALTTAGVSHSYNVVAGGGHNTLSLYTSALWDAAVSFLNGAPVPTPTPTATPTPTPTQTPIPPTPTPTPTITPTLVPTCVPGCSTERPSVWAAPTRKK